MNNNWGFLVLASFILQKAGNCAGYYLIMNAIECERAAVELGILEETENASQVDFEAAPSGCYYGVEDKTVFYNSNGLRNYAETDRVSICRTKGNRVRFSLQKHNPYQSTCVSDITRKV